MIFNRKAKILLIHPNDQKAVYRDTLKYAACEPPYWCAVAAQFCVGKGIEVKIFDAEAENVSFEDVAAISDEYKPDLIGVFVTGTNLSASTQKMQGADLTVKAIKKKMSDIPVFMWGLHPSALPKKTLEESGADYVVAGEGFDTIVYLAEYYAGIEGEFTEEALGGLCFKKNGKFVKFGFGKLKDTAQLPMPAWELLPMEKYMPHNWHIMGEDRPQDAKGRYGVISTSIGCPYQCSYCAISALFGERRLRCWDTDRVVGEIERLVKQFNVKYIKILDECFVLNKKYVKELCEKIIEKDFNVNMWAYARVDTVDEEILILLKQAGVNWLAYGIESADDKVLSEVSKSQYTVEKTRQVMKMTRDAGINILANFMFGLPDDTKESMEESLELCREINPEWINFYVTMTYPGSPDYFDGVKSGKINNDKWLEYAQYSYECKPAGGKYLSPREVLEFRDYAFNAFFEDNDNYFNMIRNKFGQQYVESIQNMTKNKLKRKLLGD
jgi:radical SAM superfamily enzyme YgiQ (UPF0313 family)